MIHDRWHTHTYVHICIVQYIDRSCIYIYIHVSCIVPSYSQSFIGFTKQIRITSHQRAVIATCWSQGMRRCQGLQPPWLCMTIAATKLRWLMWQIPGVLIWWSFWVKSFVPGISTWISWFFRWICQVEEKSGEMMCWSKTSSIGLDQVVLSRGR